MNIPVCLVLILTGYTLTESAIAMAQGSPDLVQGVECQPLASATKHLIEAMDYFGSPLSAVDKKELNEAFEGSDPVVFGREIQRILDRKCLALVHINPESRVKVQVGPAIKELAQNGWRSFLVKVHNEAGVTARLRIESESSLPVFQPSSGAAEPSVTVSGSDIPHRFLSMETVDRPPMREALSGLSLEYAIVQLYSRDAGKREATLSFSVGQGTQDIGFRNEIPILFECLPSVIVKLEVLDFDGAETTASFVFRDAQDRVYPSPGKRLAPDFFFHEQVYRHHGESVLLPPGDFKVEYTRGPEYKKLSRVVTIPDASVHKESFRLERWIHIEKEGWRSGDHHIHDAGCSHYESPTQGVLPVDMMRHILGEDLNVGCVLSWGPCWYNQKQHFTGETHPLSTGRYIMRYDVEVSGFPSSHAGHLTLLRLKEDDYESVKRIEDWPSWDLPVLQWAKKQGAITGFSHSGFGLEVPGNDLPNYAMPRFDGIGANEYIVDVVHDAVDFIATVDTPAIWELNIWYHTLNCGYRTRISGETDFPCIYGERVGLGRVYVKMPEGPINFDHWVFGLARGRSYVSDGHSHLLDFAVNEVRVGETGTHQELSELRFESPEKVVVTARVSALLNEARTSDIRERPMDERPFWHLERARIDESRRVPLELIVNGEPVAVQEIEADGRIVPVRFEVEIPKSSWVALRILPSSHTNPVFVIVDDKPVRANRRSAEWCLEAVDVCYESKRRGIRESEQEAALAAYDVAREAYKKILSESK